MELWHAATQELDRLQHIHQKTISDGQIYNSQTQQLKVGQSMADIQSKKKNHKFVITYTTRWSYCHQPFSY